MILVDANLLLYACNSSAREHPRAAKWLEEVLNGVQPVGLTWLALLAFLRVSTNPRLLPNPYTIGEAVAIVQSWLEQPAVERIEPSERFWRIFANLVIKYQLSGARVSDAALAAIAIEHGLVLCTADRDFLNFAELRSMNPLTASAE